VTLEAACGHARGLVERPLRVGHDACGGALVQLGPCRLPQQLGELLGAEPQLRAVRQEADASLVRLPAAHHGAPATAQVPVIRDSE
jgi:hypothetical protein